MINSISLLQNSSMVPTQANSSTNNEQSHPPITPIKNSSGFKPVSYTTPNGDLFIGFYLSVNG